MIGREPLLRTAVPLLLISAIVIGIWHGRSLDVATIIQRIGELGPLAWLAFMALYAVATVLFLPGSVLTLAGGVTGGVKMPQNRRFENAVTKTALPT